MTALTVTQQTDIRDLLFKNMKAIKSVAPKHLTPERVLRIAYTAIVRNPKLSMCSQVSLLNSVIESTMLGLEIGGPLGLAHLVPFKGKATLIVGYGGFIQLGYNSGKIKNFSFHPVYQSDEFSYHYGVDPDLKHVPSNDESPGELVYAYAIANFDGGKVI
ncbi:unnamed protein product [marine sediment metagenome]|uniref:Uncharacterized protein n=1 Tax=marine sediment metagenome TaxID=412755 RepID=X1BJY6_9ZZZZ